MVENEEYDYDIRLVVGSGELPTELDLEELRKDINARTDENSHPQPGLHAYPDDDDLPMATFYQSGCYIVRAQSVDELYETNSNLVLEEATRLGLIDESQRDTLPFNIVNVVGTVDLDTSIELSALAIGLGLEYTEYEPEQFPALVYHRSKYPCTFLVFANGNVVAPGAESVEEGKKAFDDFYQELKEWI